MQKYYSTLKLTVWSILILSVAIFAVIGCKDSSASHKAAESQSCLILFNDKEWDDAIKACTDAGGDENLHYAAQSYMSRAGISLFNLLIDISDSSSNASKIFYDKIPDTASKMSDYNKALNIIMNDINTRTSIMNLEATLLSGMLIFNELKSLLDLTWQNDHFETCAGSPGAENITNCGFAPYDNASVLTFGGLGTVFYDHVCGDSSVVTDTGTHTDGVARNVTIHGCTIQTGSLMAYNATAVAAYENSGNSDIIDSIAPLKFKANMDQGANFNKSIGGLGNVFFCYNDVTNDPTPAKPVTDDAKLSDCEILGYLESPGF